MEVESSESFFDEADDDILYDDDFISELLGGEKDSTSSSVLRQLVNFSEVSDLSPEDVSLLRCIKSRLDDACVPEDTQDRLRRINITIPWCIPLQHTLEPNPSYETSKPRKLLAEMKKWDWSLEMNIDDFDESEDYRIEKQWNRFVKVYQIDNPHHILTDKRLGGLLSKEQKVKFAQYLGKHLPNRFLCSILHRFSEISGTIVRKRWQRVEDELLLQIKGSDHIKYKTLVSSVLLRRVRASIGSRTYTLSTPPHILYSVPRHKWNGFEDDKKLIEFFMKVFKSETLKDLESKRISVRYFCSAAREIPCHFLSALGRWKLRISSQCFATQPLYKYELCVKLIRWLKAKNYDDWKEIEWPELRAELHNTQKTFITALFRFLITKWDRYYRSYRYDLRRCVDYLHEKAIPRLEKWKWLVEKNIKRYRFNEEGELYAYC